MEGRKDKTLIQNSKKLEGDVCDIFGNLSTVCAYHGNLAKILDINASSSLSIFPAASLFWLRDISLEEFLTCNTLLLLLSGTASWPWLLCDFSLNAKLCVLTSSHQLHFLGPECVTLNSRCPTPNWPTSFALFAPYFLSRTFTQASALCGLRAKICKRRFSRDSNAASDILKIIPTVTHKTHRPTHTSLSLSLYIYIYMHIIVPQNIWNKNQLAQYAEYTDGLSAEG